jgi:hypothetical protein
MTHTPGTWRIDYTADNDHMADQVAHNSDWLAVEVVDDDIGGHVAYCHYNNAPLIAAAPELLTACKALVALIERDYGGYDAIEEWQQATAAIAKTEEKT